MSMPAGAAFPSVPGFMLSQAGCLSVVLGKVTSRCGGFYLDAWSFRVSGL